jgi:hypothetical protein
MSAGDGAVCIDSIEISAEAPAATVSEQSKNINPTNHMHWPEVGAFILPSVARLPVTPPPDVQIAATARQSATTPHAAHGRAIR